MEREIVPKGQCPGEYVQGAVQRQMSYSRGEAVALQSGV